ncbi:MAG TPA: cob(I)yrinic acid a,c-diamide adenosyltransferase [Anaerolineae bacterium]|nr:cob(I)yrinic acid a,c-diamide adenosyltransferase [Anaerolineae bacterium]
MAVFTRKGDEGLTDLWGGIRIRKDDPIIEMLGLLDEASAFVGLARSVIEKEDLQALLLRVQDDLARIMAEIASSKSRNPGIEYINPTDTDWLEKQISEYENNVQLPERFIPAGNTYEGALVDVSRTIVRKAERYAVRLIKDQKGINKNICIYLNRLSSLLFIMRIYLDTE